MTGESFFRIISLAILMIGFGVGRYRIQLTKLQNNEIDEQKVKTQAKEEGIKYSVVLGVVYMVIILGISGLF